jgi:hypothetical protein
VTKIPTASSGTCLDLQEVKEAGDPAKGIYFVGTTPITQRTWPPASSRTK